MINVLHSRYGQSLWIIHNKNYSKNFVSNIKSPRKIQFITRNVEHILGNYTIFSRMTDWNPAEIIEPGQMQWHKFVLPPDY